MGTGEAVKNSSSADRGFKIWALPDEWLKYFLAQLNVATSNVI